MAFPGVYPDENKIIPYSPRRKFGFASPITGTITDKIIELESMTNMSIDQIVGLYKEGYTIEDTGSNVTALPFEHTPPMTYERERKYGFMNGDDVIPPGIVERYERERKYGFTGKGSQIVIGGDVILLIGIAALAYLYLKKK